VAPHHAGASRCRHNCSAQLAGCYQVRAAPLNMRVVDSGGRPWLLMRSKKRGVLCKIAEILFNMRSEHFGCKSLPKELESFFVF